MQNAAGAVVVGDASNGEATFITTKPLVANPVLPQFARPGDQFQGGAAVTNGTAAAGQLRLDAALAGPLAFLIDGHAVPSTSFTGPLARITTAYRFPIVVTGTGTATATIRVRSGNAGDAFAIPLPVRDLDVLESVADTGTTTTRASVPLDVAAGTPRDAGGLDIELASSLIPEITVAAQAALSGSERLTISAAGRLAVAADLVLLGARGGADTTASKQRATAEIAVLAGLRRGDGGFAEPAEGERGQGYSKLLICCAHRFLWRLK